MEPGIYTDLTNEAYHSGPGVSKSGLDLIADCPSKFLWNKQAPVDEEKTAALDMGTALHCVILEPEEFEDRFIVAPVFNGRTNEGKAAKKAFYEDCASLGKTIMTAEEGRKLKIMRESVMAHPTARWLLEEEGQNEASIYWSDEETGELCRIRPDRMISDRALIVDVKKVDDMSRFKRHIEEFRYHVQDAMYSHGFKQHFGEDATFLFLAVSSSINAGRYPVDVIDLTPDWKEAGFELFRRDLDTYHQCRTADDWMHIHTLERPRWARAA
ncbi:PD-(D/E)XK nuclease-like domain-containing protein [Pontibacterium sp.]|uniref:PD-(D/E)XK nuclease-like domain-containing protein n=1 Tax=Pontibacterium sp. TaxID=2036026 RepID=UPI00356959C1